MKHRKPFVPKVGETYENEGGGRYLCLNYGVHNGKVLPVMRNTVSGWTLYAHGVGIYDDGRIDWDYSTGIGFTDYVPVD